jgi:putative aminopeptidase FrvX
MSSKSILNESSMTLEKYLNNASPTGYEAEGQKIWMDYLKPYVDTFMTDTYGTAVNHQS